jgi:putative ABC transport system permease protein
MKRSKFPSPPRLAVWLVKRLERYGTSHAIVDDMHEVFARINTERGYFLACLWYWVQCLDAVIKNTLFNFRWRLIMLKNYLKIVIRLIQRKKLFSLLNLAGLTIGLTGSLLIVLYVDFELGYDRFHENADNIYRVYMHQPGNKVTGSTKDLWVTTPTILKPTWKNDLPEIRLIANIRNWGVVFQKNEQLFDENVLFADPEFLEIFTFPLMSGNKKTALVNPFSLLITKSMAEKYFGKENPVGKTILTSDEREYMITGVMQNIPENSHLKFDFLASFNTLYNLWDRDWESTRWLNNGFDTYLTLPAGIDLEQFDDKLRKYDLEGFNGKTWSFHVQPLKDIYFNRDTGGDGDIRYIFIFSGIALFILFIACFNFINLSTARSASRAKEVGVRKVVGAHKRQLVRQLLGESFLFTFIALVFSIIVVLIILPVFSSVIGKELGADAFLSMKLLMAIMGIFMLVGTVSGCYPALFISSFQPVKILKGNLRNKSKGSVFFRDSLVVVQFAISIIMIISTITLYHQLNYIRNKKLGYDEDQILTFSRRGLDDLEPFKNELLKNSGILKVSASSGLPTHIGWSNIPSWEGKSPDENPFFYRLSVDYDFFDLYGLEIVQGRKFSREMGDDGKAYILNEAAVKSLGFKEPIGQMFGFWKISGTVVGVAKDFHFESLHKPITPLGIGIQDSTNFNYVSVKISAYDIGGSIKYIEDTWKKFSPKYPFEFSFIDERLDAMYKNERKITTSFNYFALIAIFIACLGLFGLASFTAEQKTKEIGIRKVLGASASKIIVLLTKEFILLVALANCIAWPLAWYGMNKWLESFAYRIDLNIAFFVLAGIAAFIIAIASVSAQFAKATRANPIDSLRYE